MKNPELTLTERQLAAPDAGRVLRGLLWSDWRRHRMGIVLGLGSIAIVSLQVGMIESASRAMFFLLAMAMAAGCGAGFGRAEWLMGQEEFALALPPTRRQRYLVRLALACAVLAGIYAIGGVAYFTDWARDLGELLSLSLPEMELTAQPAWTLGTGFLAFVIAAPLATLVETFALFMATERRADVRWALELVLVAAGGLGLYLLDRSLFESAGWLSSPVLIAFAVVRARLGLGSYERKDAVLESGVAEETSRRSLFLILALLTGLGVAALIGMKMYNAASHG